MSEISRREFLRVSALAGAGIAVAACAKTAEPTAAPKEEPTATPQPEQPTPTPEPEELPYQESPFLTEQVSAGKLPAQEDRLPENPFLVRHGVLMPADELDFEVGKFGGTLRSVHNNVGWNPDVFVMCNESLVMGPGLSGADIRGGILESFEVSGDAKVFTFHMRKGLKWSDGEAVTTDDVQFAYEDVLLSPEITPAFPAWLRAGNTAAGAPMELEVLDAYTYEVRFDQPYGGFDVQLAIVGWRGYTEFLIPRHYMSQFHVKYTPLEDLEPLIAEAELTAGEWWTLFGAKDHTNWERTRPTSIGFPALTPWLMVETSPAIDRYERNPYYFKVDEEGQQLPYIDGIDDRLVENVETIVMSVIAGEVDFLYEAGAMPSVPVYKENEENGGYNAVLLRSHTEPATIYINMTYEDDTWRQVVRDVRFRQAVNYSLNRQEIIESVWLGSGAELPEHIPNEFDPGKANALLDEIGLDQRDAEGYRLGPNGETFEIPFELANRTPEMSPTAELVVEYLNDVGLKTTMKIIDSGLRSQRSNANELMATIERNTQPPWWQRHTGWYMPGEWGRLWEIWRTSGGESGEEPPPEVREFVELAAKTMVVPANERQGILDQMDALLYENLFFICPVERERRPIIASKRMGNVAHDGFSIAACFAGEQFFFES